MLICISLIDKVFSKQSPKICDLDVLLVTSILKRPKLSHPRTEFSADTVTLPAVKELMQEFRSDVLAKRHHEKDAERKSWVIFGIWP